MKRPRKAILRIHLEADQLRRLTLLATAKGLSVPALVDSLLDRLDQAILRPGSWERGCFENLYGEALDVAAGKVGAL